MRRDDSAFPEPDVSPGLSKWEYTVIELARGAMESGKEFSQVGMSKFCTDFADRLWREMEMRDASDD